MFFEKDLGLPKFANFCLLFCRALLKGQLGGLFFVF